MNELSDKIESILFVSNKPLNAKILSKLLNDTEENILLAVNNLAEARKNTGIVLLSANGNFQLATNAKNSEVVTGFLNSDLREKLTDASIEVLAIIAYRQPISRSEIEAIRGVNSQYSIRHLLMRGLIEKLNNPGDARGSLYQITTEFLQHMGITDVKDLPQFDELVKNIKLPETPDTKPLPNTPLDTVEPTEPNDNPTHKSTDSALHPTEDTRVILHSSPSDDPPVTLTRPVTRSSEQSTPQPQIELTTPNSKEKNEDIRVVLNGSPHDDPPVTLNRVSENPVTLEKNQSENSNQISTHETQLNPKDLNEERHAEILEISTQAQGNTTTTQTEDTHESFEESNTLETNEDLNSDIPTPPQKPLNPPRPPKITINNTAN